MTKKSRGIIYIGSLLAISLPFGFAISCSYDVPSYKIKEIWEEENVPMNKKDSFQFHDGDTLVLKERFKSTTSSYRIYGIDTPELSHLKNNSWVDAPEKEKKWARKALDKAKKWWKNYNPWILILKNKKTYDRNIVKLRGYSLANVYGSHNWKYDFGLYLVSEGLARVGYISTDLKSKYYTNNKKYYEELKLAEKSAKSKKKGFWAIKENIFISKPSITN